MKGFNSIDAATLMDKPLPNSCFLVEGLVPEGVNMISGAPKVGKSWLMLDLALSIASGEPFLGQAALPHRNIHFEFDYSGLTMDKVIKHLARFISSLWQIHVFFEGNTRTTAVFFIKYLQSLGFNVTNEIFNTPWILLKLLDWYV